MKRRLNKLTISKEENAKRMSLNLLGYSDNKISKMLGISRSSIGKWRKLRNIKPNYKHGHKISYKKGRPLKKKMRGE